MIHSHSFDGIPLQTGDVICTRDGAEGSLFGMLWRQLGRLLPGEVDHCVVYVGPGGRCVESGARGVIVFDMPGERWDAAPLAVERALLDSLVGVAYPLAGSSLPAEEQLRVRAAVAAFCLEQAELRRPYNLNFLDAESDLAFYCSQLVYKAYRTHGIDLNRRSGAPLPLALLEPVVFPEEIWHASPERRTLRDRSLGQ